MGIKKQGYFYILSNSYNNVLYCGATNNLVKRVLEHRTGHYPKSFSKRYNVHKLVYYETHVTVAGAFAREKQVKGGSRRKKTALIVSMNPDWKDLFWQLSSNSLEELIKLRNHFT